MVDPDAATTNENGDWRCPCGAGLDQFDVICPVCKTARAHNQTTRLSAACAAVEAAEDERDAARRELDQEAGDGR